MKKVQDSKQRQLSKEKNQEGTQMMFADLLGQETVKTVAKKVISQERNKHQKKGAHYEVLAALGI